VRKPLLNEKALGMQKGFGRRENAQAPIIDQLPFAELVIINDVVLALFLGFDDRLGNLTPMLWKISLLDAGLAQKNLVRPLPDFFPRFTR